MTVVRIRSMGLGLPRTRLRKERRRTRKAAGRRGLRILGGILTGGLTTAATANRVRESGQENILNRSLSAGLPDEQLESEINLQSGIPGDTTAPEIASAQLDDALANGANLEDALRRAGITPDADTASDDIVDMRITASGASVTQEMIAQFPEAQVKECDCLVKQLAQLQGAQLSQPMWDSGMTGCLQNLSGFRAAVAESGGRTESCKPLYKRKSTWLVVGGIAAAYVLLSD